MKLSLRVAFSLGALGERRHQGGAKDYQCQSTSRAKGKVFAQKHPGEYDCDHYRKPVNLHHYAHLTDLYGVVEEQPGCSSCEARCQKKEQLAAFYIAGKLQFSACDDYSPGHYHHNACANCGS